ncbi:unnamed protein product [Euphydryas editha]|uniref:Uncharacterized protein n=1 Tax=Euphydryas editha TaxID=104508 RepID=A0AAU9UIZ3_EUPED|nr:unnamed protein product [Euphydryas editha]
MIGKPERVSEPLERVVNTKKKSLLDLKSLLEDRGGIIEASTKGGFRRNVFEKDKVSSNNSIYRLDNNVSFDLTTFSESNTMRFSGKSIWGRCCRLKTILCLLLVVIFVNTRLQAEARSSVIKEKMMTNMRGIRVNN